MQAKYLEDGRRLLSEGDYVQAGEKYWGAVATMVKFVAAERGLKHFGHADLRNVVRTLRRETEDDEYVSLFSSAEKLHANFYEDFLDSDSVAESAMDASRLIEKLKATLGRVDQ